MARLAIFLDGTWNTLDNNTNVWRLKALCDPNAIDQRVYYGRGVGTAPGQHFRGGAIGFGIDREILDAYEWLVEAFQPHDDVFIFGFSRGAYAARSLSGLIAKCGVLQPGAPLSVEQLYARYKLYSAKTLAKIINEGDPSQLDFEERWMAKYCLATPIRFIGVWDTVGSMGSPLASMQRRVQQYRFLDTHLRKQNELAFHALALDEHRRAFEPTLWTASIDNSAATTSQRPLSQVEQRWFVGAHANVGGGYPSDVLAQPPLRWIMEKAQQAGLIIRPGVTIEAADPCAPINDSYATFTPWPLRPFMPRFNRIVGKEPDRDARLTTSRINETVDASIFERWRGNSSYRPPSLIDWGKRKGIDPSTISGSVLADDPSAIVP